VCADALDARDVLDLREGGAAEPQLYALSWLLRRRIHP